MSDFLISGCGLSGTHYMSEVLNNAGIDSLHEEDNDDCYVTVSWKHIVDYTDYDVILHQVRNPRKVVTSFEKMASRRSWSFITKRINLEGISRLEKTIDYYIKWNSRVCAKSLFTYRIEDIQEVFPLITSYIKDVDYDKSVFDTDKHSRKSDKGYGYYSWSDLKDKASNWKQLLIVSNLYGYEEETGV